MIYLFLADGFEETESIVPLDILRRLGADIKTVGVGGRVIRGAHDISVTADIALEDAADDFEMLILPGGMPGTDNLRKSPKVINMIKKAYDQGKYIAAICAAPSILGGLGLLKGKRATCFPGYEESLQGANVTGNAVEVDGHIITAKGVGAADKFGFALAQLLFGRDKAQDLRRKMQYDG